MRAAHGHRCLFPFATSLDAKPVCSNSRYLRPAPYRAQKRMHRRQPRGRLQRATRRGHVDLQATAKRGGIGRAVGQSHAERVASGQLLPRQLALDRKRKHDAPNHSTPMQKMQRQRCLGYRLQTKPLAGGRECSPQRLVIAHFAVEGALNPKERIERLTAYVTKVDDRGSKRSETKGPRRLRLIPCSGRTSALDGASDPRKFACAHRGRISQLPPTLKTPTSDQSLAPRPPHLWIRVDSRVRASITFALSITVAITRPICVAIAGSITQA